MSRPSTSKRADVENADFCLPNAVPDFDAVPNNGPLSKVRRAASGLNPRRGGEEISPAYAEAKSPTVFGADMDFNLPNAVQTFDNIDNIVTLSEVGCAAGNLNPHGGGKEKVPTVLGWRGEDGGMDFVLPNAVPDTVPNIGSLLDRRTGSSNPRGGGKEFTPTDGQANSPTEKPPKSQNTAIKSLKVWLTAKCPFLQKDKVETLIPSELNADSANPNLKDDAGLASPELKSNISPDQRKGFFDRLWRGKAEPVPTPQLKADPAIPDVREVVDLADPRSKTNVGPKKHKKKASKSRPDKCLQSKKVKTVVPNQQLDADPAIPDAMDGADLACPKSKTEISPDKGKPWKRRFLDCFRKGKVESMPTPYLEADPAIPDVREVVDLADPRSKTNVGPKKHKKKASKESPFNLQRKKVKTVVPNQQLDADPAIPDAMDGADLACPESKTKISPDKLKALKRRFLDCFRRGNVESVPTPQLEADPAIPDVREVVDLAGPQSKSNVGPKKLKQKFDAEQLDANPAIPVAMDGANLGSCELKTHISIAAANATLQKIGAVPANIGLKGGGNADPNRAKNPGSKDDKNPRPKALGNPRNPRICKTKGTNNPGPKDAGNPGAKDDNNSRPKALGNPRNPRICSTKGTNNLGPKDAENPGAKDDNNSRPKALGNPRNPRICNPKGTKNPVPKDAGNPGAKDDKNPRSKAIRNPRICNPKGTKNAVSKDAGNPGTKEDKVVRPKVVNPFQNPFKKPSKKKPVDPEPLTQETFESKYQLLESDVLGQGSFGKVYRGIRKSDGSQVAIKQINKQEGDIYLQIPGYPKPLPTEVALMLKLKDAPFCPYVIEMLDWSENSQMFTLVFEYLQESESLWNFASQYKLSENTARHLMRQAVLAVKHCLENWVFHTDIHPGNILVQKTTMRLKLIDFGFGHLLNYNVFDSCNFRGARRCTPPEVGTDKKLYAMPANVWALGVLLYYIVCGSSPFSENPMYEGQLMEFDKGLSKEICDLIKWCLSMNPQHRPTLKQILDHEWFQTEYEKEKQLEYRHGKKVKITHNKGET